MRTDPKNPLWPSSLEKLSELTGLHATYLGEIERGKRDPALVSIVWIARGLNITPAKLLGRDDGRNVAGGLFEPS